MKMFYGCSKFFMEPSMPFLCMYGPIVLYFYGAFVAKIPTHFF